MDVNELYILRTGFLYTLFAGEGSCQLRMRVEPDLAGQWDTHSVTD